MRIVELGRQFRPQTSHVYPPFKNGRYMEEFMYEYITTHEIQSDYVYIPVFWTNLQNHPGFSKEKYGVLLQHALKSFSSNTKYMTIVQHDDGPQLPLPKDTLVFGACTGSIPLPLIYEDRTDRLLQTPRVQKDQLASFVGTITHPIRQELIHVISNRSDITYHVQTKWTPSISEQAAEIFVTETNRSKFCLAPRGYGRSSFRFFEAMLLDTVPVYFWDDEEWLPYKDVLDYSMFSVSISKKEIGNTYDILRGISEEKYAEMLKVLQDVRRWFTLEGMANYIVYNIQ